MGRRGPKPLPTVVKKMHGTYQPCHGAKNEMKPQAGTPDMPSWLDDEAQAEWRRVVPQLAAIGILCDVDQGMLASYCAAISLGARATRAYQKDGLMVAKGGGSRMKVKNPLIRVAQEARAQARILAAEFGMSASARSRISMPTKSKEDEDKTETFLFGAPKLVKAGNEE